MANNTITAAKGFWAAGVHCGVKKSGKLDLALLACPTGATAAAVFTTNKIVAAPVTICKKHVKSSKVYAVVINSGNANACTGSAGMKNAIAICNKVAGELNANPHSVLIASTGIIGKQLPIRKVTAGITKAAKQLRNGQRAGSDFAKAIMTTDTKCKQAVRRFEISGKKVAIAATAKGAGMIGPNMATTITVITTDIAITKLLLAHALKAAVGVSLNKLTVDGHQSTNDTAVIMASGAAGNRPVTSPCPRYRKFAKALTEVCADLTRQMALDAEGATRMFTVVVKGAATKADACKAARAVADYNLVKCAVHGADPNWGRIICAAGSCGVKLYPDKMSCKIGDITVFRNGRPTKFDAKKASKVISRTGHTITIDLGAGKYTDFCFGCDLSADYVKINADYHT
ncbi:MAG TPA: bifunctional glutamate N-acetyltransferase/amino-acid acetyltransferase ArgJ [Planctomycetes bacterium]|nr:bifunctional glutamate N-acetyltransferase/amino-acid acetyltransferase ArgJ [Planctomycetota bacterium]HIJ71447.1 bifunctional glutamate N-acetyltransferase/amino-acid acetyltransferase ArgJ [Planctomycetota bacterium]